MQALARIRQLVVHIKAMEEDGMPPSLRAGGTLLLDATAVAGRGLAGATLARLEPSVPTGAQMIRFMCGSAEDASMPAGELRIRFHFGTARAEDAQGTPTQSPVSPSILVYADNRICWVSRHIA